MRNPQTMPDIRTENGSTKPRPKQPAPLGRRLVGRLAILGLLLTVPVALGLLTGCGKPGSGGAKAQVRYHCPMHPTYVSDRPGDCPICGMRLVPIRPEQKTTQPAPEPSAEAAKIAQVKPGQFYCPMGAEHVQDTPGQCPKCGMELVEKKAPPVSPEGQGSPMQAAAVPGRVPVSISPEKRQLIGLTFAKVERRSLRRSVRTAAVLEHDETRYARIAPRFAGWVRKLHVNFTGAPVEQGQPLFTVYSPELFAAQNDYLVAWRSMKQLQDDAPAPLRDSAQALLDSARQRLTLLQIGPEEVRALEERGQASAELLFRAPVSGYVTVKKAVEGQAFVAGETLYEIADLSHLWLWAYLFELDLPWVTLGQQAMVHLPYLTNQPFAATVTFIYPEIEAQTRRGQVRLEVDNPRHELRPGMWADVELQLDLGDRLAVPASAILDTGQRHIAFVAGSGDLLEPREVQVGARTDDHYEVLAGLKEGEQVVRRALFLVDSESQLRAAISAMSPAEPHRH